MTTVTNVDLGTLSLGEVDTRNGFMPGGRETRVDIYKFKTGSVGANVAITSSGNTAAPFGLQLFRDTNGSGVFDNGDTFANSSDGTTDVGDGAFESMNTFLTRGTYFARFQSFAFEDIPYTATFARATSGGANPLAGPEIQLGTITKDLTRRNTVSDTDTADNFAFSLGRGKLDINVINLNQKGDFNARVVQDRNSNGIVDRGEVVAEAVRIGIEGDIQSISDLSGRGDYILQVCQSQGTSKFRVNFDVSGAIPINKNPV